MLYLLFFSSSWASDIFVGGAGGKTLEEALSIAGNGDTIILLEDDLSGEPIDISQENLTIKGEVGLVPPPTVWATMTVVNAGGAATGVGLTLQGFTLAGSLTSSATEGLTAEDMTFVGDPLKGPVFSIVGDNTVFRRNWMCQSVQGSHVPLVKVKGQNGVVENNLFAGWSGGPGLELSNGSSVRVEFNSFFQGADYAVKVGANNVSIVQGNAFVGGVGGIDAAVLTADYNLFYDLAQDLNGISYGSHDVQADPLFMAPSFSGAQGCEGLDLRPGDLSSPLLGAGPGGEDIGAFGGPEAPPYWDDTDHDNSSYLEDCDDSDPAVSPLEVDICDGLDNDCNGVPDDDPNEYLDQFLDEDGDGFGGATVRGCDTPDDNLVFEKGDCDDKDPHVNPDGVELCDLVDNNCDGLRDNVTDPLGLWWPDADGDGVGLFDGDGTCAWAPGLAYGERGEDVDDTDVYLQEEGQAVVAEGYDCDGDGFGTSTLANGCELIAYNAPLGDCDDTDPTVNPRAVERCDGKDNDCDELIDTDYNPLGTEPADDSLQPSAGAGPIDGPDVYWFDEDGDGVGAYPGRGWRVCSGEDVPADWSDTSADCDDTNTTNSPEPTEYFWDCDGDSYGNNEVEPVRSCVALAEMEGCAFVTDATDCNDGQSAINPGVIEAESDLGNDGEWGCTNGIDDNCDGRVDAEDPECQELLDTGALTTDTDEVPGEGGAAPAPGGCSCQATPGSAPVAWLWGVGLWMVWRRRGREA